MELFENEVDIGITKNSKIYEKFLDVLNPGYPKRKKQHENPTDDDLNFEINFDGYQKKKKKPKVKITKTKVPTGFRINRQKCDENGVLKLFDTKGALITVVEKTREKPESSKQFWELIKDRGLKRPVMHRKYC